MYKYGQIKYEKDMTDSGIIFKKDVIHKQTSISLKTLSKKLIKPRYILLYFTVQQSF